MTSRRRALFVLGTTLVAAASCASKTPPPAAAAHFEGPCPPEMAHVERFCVDKWEAYVVELDAKGDERAHSPYVVVEGLRIRAKSAPGVVPQGYISEVEAQAACHEAGKRLCHADEYLRACRGPSPVNWYPYGGQWRVPGKCNEGKFSSVTILFGSDASLWTYANFNDPRDNQLEGGLAKTGAFPECVSPDGAFDMVGNLHEWIDEPPDGNHHGRFRGGSYGDAEKNGRGCQYATSAHEITYHDYSTGFRCCMDAR